MNIKPIKNNRDYREALKEFDRLMDAQPNSPEGDRLDVLVTLVEAWEKSTGLLIRLIRLRGSSPLCSTNNPSAFNYLQPQVYDALFLV